VTQYELWKAIWSSLNDRNFFELAWALERHNGFLETFAPLTFLGNHDVTRIASKLRDERHLELAAAILFTVGGVPAVYAGDEQGFRGVKEDREGGDDAVRPAFPDDPSGLAPTGWPLYRLHQRLIELRRRHGPLTRARTAVSTLTNTAIVYTTGTVTVALNAADEPATLSLPHAGLAVEAGGGELSGGSLRLPGPGWGVLTGAGCQTSST
jgi:cyclomaltodextrinase